MFPTVIFSSYIEIRWMCMCLSCFVFDLDWYCFNTLMTSQTTFRTLYSLVACSVWHPQGYNWLMLARVPYQLLWYFCLTSWYHSGCHSIWRWHNRVIYKNSQCVYVFVISRMQHLARNISLAISRLQHTYFVVVYFMSITSCLQQSYVVMFSQWFSKT